MSKRHGEWEQMALQCQGMEGKSPGPTRDLELESQAVWDEAIAGGWPGPYSPVNWGEDRRRSTPAWQDGYINTTPN